jgi:GR25 family glycosyltransferase involved in LPS biosynthesis
MINIPTFCINVASSTYRWATITRRLTHDNIPVTRWDAATPSTLGSLPYVHYLSAGQRACAKSHYDIWSYQVTHSIPKIMVFEDDAVLRKDFVPIVNSKLATIDEVDPDWDLLLLNAAEEVYPMNTWVNTRNQCMAAGYILSLRGAKELVALGKDTLYASDWMTQILQHRGHTYTMFPWLVIQDGSVSLIRGEPPTADWNKVVRLLDSVGYSLGNYNF